MSVLLAVMFNAYKECKVKLIQDLQKNESLALLKAWCSLTTDRVSEDGQKVNVPDLSIQECRALLEVLYPTISSYRARLIFEFMDEDGSGEIEAGEFLLLPEALRLEVRREERGLDIDAGCLKHTRFGKKLLVWVNHPRFEIIIMIVILANMLVMAIQSSAPAGCLENEWSECTLLDYLDLLILLIFNAEMVMKILAKGKNYFLDWSNIWVCDRYWD